MTNKPMQPPGGFAPPNPNRPTSPPPPRRKPEEIIIHSLPPTPPLPVGVTIPDAIAALREENHRLSQRLAAANERGRQYQLEQLLLTGQIENLTERLRKYECPNCGDSEQIVDCHHDGNMLAPECDFKYCNGCGHQWGNN